MFSYLLIGFFVTAAYAIHEFMGLREVLEEFAHLSAGKKFAAVAVLLIMFVLFWPVIIIVDAYMRWVMK